MDCHVITFLAMTKLRIIFIYLLYSMKTLFTWAFIFVFGFVIGAGVGIGKIGGSAMEAIARQPEASGDIRMNMIIAAALIEGVALLAVVVCLLVFFL
jgi:ATP synthase F0 subunit c